MIMIVTVDLFANHLWLKAITGLETREEVFLQSPKISSNGIPAQVGCGHVGLRRSGSGGATERLMPCLV